MASRKKQPKRRSLSSLLPQFAGLSRRGELERQSLKFEPLEQRTLLAVDIVVDDALAASISQASNLSAYTAAELSATREWVVGFAAGSVPNAATLETGISGTVVGPAGKLPNSLVVRFDAATPWEAISAELAGLETADFHYPLVKREYATYFVPNDTYFGDQWHLRNIGQTQGTIGEDANLTEVWDEFLGRGVIIGIVDDSLQYTHPDLRDKYRADLSYDYLDGDSDPAPSAFDDDHGTAVAGVAAGTGNNRLGITGSAPAAALAGIRLIGGPISDFDIADALNHQNQEIDVYNNSWGVGRGLEAPLVAGGPITQATLLDGVSNGRGGLGSIYLFAGGNSLAINDDTNYSALSNSRFVITVAAIDDNGVQSTYSNRGASLLISGHSSSGGRPGIVTADRVGGQGYNSAPGGGDGDAFLDLDYTSTFGGTSSATPLVTGVVALMLEANPNLGWRDVQYILVESARQNDAFDTDWFINGAGFHVNHKYGFGAVDAQAAVNLARDWTNVVPETAIRTPLIPVNRALPDGGGSVISRASITADINVEKVEIVVNATHSNVGDLQITLNSPGGTASILAEPRIDTSDNIVNWIFSTARNWGESSQGTWSLTIADRVTAETGTFDSWRLNIFGVTTDPPLAVDDFVSTFEDTAVNINVLANDSDPDGTLDVSTVAIAATPSNGSVSVDASGRITYTPAQDFVGVDTFTYTVRDNENAISRPAQVTVTVGGVNDPPVAVNDSAQVDLSGGVLIDVLSNDSDTDGFVDATSVEIVSVPTHGTVSVNAATGVVTYVAGPSFTRTDSFTYRAKDNFGLFSNVAVVTVNKANSLPVAGDDAISTFKNVTVTIDVLANDSDSDGSIEISTVSVLGSPSNGAVSVDTATGRIVYSPNQNFFGNDTITYTVRDNEGGVSNVASVTVTVENVGPPVASDDEFILIGGFPAVRVIAVNNGGGSGNPLSVRLVSGPALGTLRLAGDGAFTYDQGPGFRGLDSFTYVINDGALDSNVATVRLVSSDFAGVRRMYDDLMARGASDGEVLFWTNALLNGAPRQGIVNFFLNSTEYRARSVDHLYRTLLGRGVDAVGVNYWMAQLAFGVTLDRISAELAASEEFYIKNGFSDDGFIRGLYRDLLGRTTDPAPGEIAAWQGALDSGASRIAITFSFVNTREYRTNLVKSYYTDFLGRPADPTGLAFWVAQLQTGRRREIVQQAILSSDEYFNPLES